MTVLLIQIRQSTQPIRRVTLMALVPTPTLAAVTASASVELDTSTKIAYAVSETTC